MLYIVEKGVNFLSDGIFTWNSSMQDVQVVLNGIILENRQSLGLFIEIEKIYTCN